MGTGYSHVVMDDLMIASCRGEELPHSRLVGWALVHQSIGQPDHFAVDLGAGLELGVTVADDVRDVFDLAPFDLTGRRFEIEIRDSRSRSPSGRIPEGARTSLAEGSRSHQARRT
jgi:hypothetical protein